MPEDNNTTLEKISEILERWSSHNKKKKKEERTKVGLESKLGTLKNLTIQEESMFSTMLKNTAVE